MASLNQIVTILAERVGRQYDLVFKRELKTIVNTWRSTILRQTLKDSPRETSHFQLSWVMPIQKDFKIKCPFNYGCVLRTVDKVPQGLRLNQFPYSFVGSADLETPYTYIYPSQLSTIKSNRNARKNNGYYTILNGYGYFYNIDENIKYIGISGIPNDLNEVTKFQKCDGTAPCYTDDDQYPLTEDLVQKLIQAVLGTELKNQVKPEDTEVKVNGDQR
jgi:hypothetical protein